MLNVSPLSFKDVKISYTPSGKQKKVTREGLHALIDRTEITVAYAHDRNEGSIFYDTTKPVTVERLDGKGYVGVVKSCPLKLIANRHRMELPIDYFCDYICSIIYPEGYRLLGLNSCIEKVKDGCRLEITLAKAKIKGRE